MGVTTDAILCFGVDMGESPGFPWMQEDNEFDEWMANRIGIYYPFKGNDKEWNDWYSIKENKEAMSLYWNIKRDLENGCPVQIVYHCSAEYSEYILAVRGTVTKANRGYPEKITHLEVDRVKINEYMTTLKEWGIELPEQPEWLLASYWG